ncbi:MAG: hypothetical protein KAI03_06970 [Candidatus Aureabacteria bacterium]|nr:hypothetical protein [Candidatus Auribacterota bacterium]
MLPRNKIKIFGCLASSITGILLFLCFFLFPVSEYSILVEIYKKTEITRIFGFEAKWEYAGTLWKYVVPYAGGLLIAILHMGIIRKKKGDFPIERDLFMLLSLFVIMKFSCCVFEMIGCLTKGVFSPLQDGMIVSGLIFGYFGILLVYMATVLRRLEDLRKIGVYQAVFGMVYGIWIGFNILTKSACYGMEVVFWCMLMLVLSGNIIYRSIPQTKCTVKYS